jgi:hypothetical protein
MGTTWATCTVHHFLGVGLIPAVGAQEIFGLPKIPLLEHCMVVNWKSGGGGHFPRKSSLPMQREACSIYPSAPADALPLPSSLKLSPAYPQRLLSALIMS